MKKEMHPIKTDRLLLRPIIASNTGKALAMQVAFGWHPFLANGNIPSAFSYLHSDRGEESYVNQPVAANSKIAPLLMQVSFVSSGKIRTFD